jgi:hypothetical protein
MVHKSILEEGSSFFRKAFSKPWLRSDDKTIRIPEQKPIAFGIYLQFLCSGTIELLKTDCGLDFATPGHVSNNLVHCYILGDMLDDTDFKNDLIDKCFDRLKKGFVTGAEAITSMMEGLPSSSKLIQLHRLYFAFSLPWAAYSAIRPGLPASFLVTVAETVIRLREASDSRKLPQSLRKCFFHEHPDNRVCDSIY